MRSNEDLQKDVQDALKWEPLLKATEIGVIVKNGVVTLSGTVDSYYKKTEAEDAARNVAGVRAVVEKIEIQFGDIWTKSDSDIAKEVINAFKANSDIPKNKIKVKVENGWVTLEGALEWNFQKEVAKICVRKLDGVSGVSNNIIIRSTSMDEIEKRDIESALERSWAIEDQEIGVEVSGNTVTLNGTVNSLFQKGEAERIAWNAPGVCNVDNELYIELADKHHISLSPLSFGAR